MLLLFLALSAAMAGLLITPSGFPYLGFAVSSCIFAALGFVFQKKKTLTVSAVYTTLMLLSVFIVIRANPLLTFFNSVAIFFFLTFFVNNIEKIQSIKDLLKQPFITLATLVRTKNKFLLKEALPVKGQEIKKNALQEILLGLGVTIAIVVVIIPLLSFANPIFARLVENLLTTINLREFFEQIVGEDFYLWSSRIILFCTFSLIITRAVSHILGEKQVSIKKEEQKKMFRLFIPKITVLCILLVFFFTQIELYMASPQTLADLGISLSQHTREVFGHLLVVGLILFALIYNDRGVEKKDRIVTYLLILAGIFLTLIALKSDYDYSAQWGFTEKRLYGFAAVIWTLSAFSMLTYVIYKHHANSMIIHSLTWLTAFVLLGINFANFDYLIYNTNKSRTGQGEDQIYLAKLSPDARSYKDQLTYLLKQNKEADRYNAGYIVYHKLENLQKKYKNLDIRTFNLSEYEMYKKIEKMNLKKINEQLFQQTIVRENLQLQQSPQRVWTTITIKNLPSNLFDNYFELVSESQQSTLFAGNLDVSSFINRYEPGTYTIRIYDYGANAKQRTEASIKEIQFRVPNPPPEKMEITYK